ncbi:MAG: hypothetical protein GF398_08865 [Chitinivibrionales bacterium]|nr:hypothetical protein [Chitinivibrionales bacterium]
MSTSDTMAIMELEYEAGRYENVITLYSRLSEEGSRALLPILYLTRARAHLGRLSLEYFENHWLNDGEFLYSFAEYLYQRERYKVARQLLARAGSTQAYLWSQELLDEKITELHEKLAQK